MNIDLNTLSKDQLVQALTLYIKDVQELETQISMLSDSNKILVEKLNTTEKKLDETDAMLFNYENSYRKLNNHHKKALTTIQDQEEKIQALKFQVRKEQEITKTACEQAYEAKRKYRQPVYNTYVNEVNVYNKKQSTPKQPKIEEDIDFEVPTKKSSVFERVFGSKLDQVVVDTNGMYRPAKY
jgi:chromosome segregation ATPase